MHPILLVFVAILAAALAVTAAVYLIVPLFKGIGYAVRGIAWFVAHIFRFVFNMIGDVLRALGSLITSIIFIPLILLNIVIGRWSASAHYGRALQHELASIAHCTYRVTIGHPARLLLLDSLTEGIEQRVPEVMAKAPGADKPSKRTGTFPGYNIVGSLRGGGSGGKLYIAEPLAQKKAAFSREGLDHVDQVVIKSFSIHDGSSLPQIIRESRALEAARNLHLVLDHELTDERFFYVMPYVPGEDLSVRAQSLHAASPPDGLALPHLREGLGYVIDLLHTLDRYHAGGLWHKDIKPDNIIVHNSKAHLVDLGLVTPLRSAMTLTTHGTEYFRDPELVRLALRGVKVHEVDGVKFDIYGAGAVLFSVVENSFPAHGGLSQITRKCPDALKWVIRRSMADLNQRYPSARHMLADLSAIANAPDPFALKPADLPSMKGADLADFAPAPEDVPTPVGAPAAAVGAAAHTPEPHFARHPHEAPAPAAAPRIKVLDWWTGRYAVDPGVRRARAAHTPPPPRPRAANPRPAKDQLASARARVQAARRRARKRMHSRHGKRNPHYSNGPNTGIAVAVGTLIIAIVLGNVGINAYVNRKETAVATTFESALFTTHPAGPPVRLIVHDEDDRKINIAPRGDWANGPDELAVAILKPDGATFAENGFHAPTLLRALFADAHPDADILLVNDLPPDDPAHPDNDARWLIDALNDLNLTVHGLGDSESEIDLLAQARATIGTSLPADPQTIQRLRDWMPAQQPPIDAVIWTLPDDKWRLIPATPGNVQTFTDTINNSL